jgi:hypothetical protein
MSKAANKAAGKQQYQINPPLGELICYQLSGSGNGESNK